MTLSWNPNASHTHEDIITIELCGWSGPNWECSDGPEEISTEILFTNIYRNTYLQKYVVASPGHGHSGVGPEQASHHLVHHPAGDCRWYWWRCELVMVVVMVLIVIMVVVRKAWKTLKKPFAQFLPITWPGGDEMHDPVRLGLPSHLDEARLNKQVPEGRGPRAEGCYNLMAQLQVSH